MKVICILTLIVSLVFSEEDNQWLLSPVVNPILNWFSGKNYEEKKVINNQCNSFANTNHIYALSIELDKLTHRMEVAGNKAKLLQKKLNSLNRHNPMNFEEIVESSQKMASIELFLTRANGLKHELTTKIDWLKKNGKISKSANCSPSGYKLVIEGENADKLGSLIQESIKSAAVLSNDEYDGFIVPSEGNQQVTSRVLEEVDGFGDDFDVTAYVNKVIANLNSGTRLLLEEEIEGEIDEDLEDEEEIDEDDMDDEIDEDDMDDEIDEDDMDEEIDEDVDEEAEIDDNDENDDVTEDIENDDDNVIDEEDDDEDVSDDVDEEIDDEDASDDVDEEIDDEDVSDDVDEDVSDDVDEGITDEDASDDVDEEIDDEDVSDDVDEDASDDVEEDLDEDVDEDDRDYRLLEEDTDIEVDADDNGSDDLDEEFDDNDEGEDVDNEDVTEDIDDDDDRINRVLQEESDSVDDEDIDEDVTDGEEEEDLFEEPVIIGEDDEDDQEADINTTTGDDDVPEDFTTFIEVIETVDDPEFADDEDDDADIDIENDPDLDETLDDEQEEDGDLYNVDENNRLLQEEEGDDDDIEVAESMTGESSELDDAELDEFNEDADGIQDEIDIIEEYTFEEEGSDDEEGLGEDEIDYTDDSNLDDILDELVPEEEGELRRLAMSVNPSSSSIEIPLYQSINSLKSEDMILGKFAEKLNGLLGHGLVAQIVPIEE